jgi:hypothetical protein
MIKIDTTESEFLPLLRRFNPAESAVEKSVIFYRIKMSHAFPRIFLAT